MNQLTFVPDGGLCNRIHAVSSAICFAKKHDLRLTVIWFKDRGMGAGFHDLFTLLPAVKNVLIKDASFIDFFKYAKPIKSNFFLPKLYQRLKFDTIYFWYKEQISVEKWYHSNAGVSKFYLCHCYKFHDNCEFSNLFYPIDSIQKKIGEQLNLLSPYTIGIHIRRTDITASIKHSPLSAFIEKIQQEIAINPDANFYVASDSQEEKNKLISTVGRRIITIENNLKRNTKNGVVDALVELYMLASTKKIFGSYQSTYSIMASEIKGIPLEIVMTDDINNKYNEVDDSMF